MRAACDDRRIPFLATTVLTIDANAAVGGTTVDQTINFLSRNLYSLYGVDPAGASANADLIQAMLSQGDLLIT